MPLTVGDFLLGPLVAFAVIGVLAGVLRWIFGGDSVHPTAGVLPFVSVHPTAGVLPLAEDYGLLSAVAVTDDQASAAALRSLLATAGIRATLATGADGRVRVLVFAEELDRARRVTG